MCNWLKLYANINLTYYRSESIVRLDLSKWDQVLLLVTWLGVIYFRKPIWVRVNSEIHSENGCKNTLFVWHKYYFKVSDTLLG